MRGEPQPFSERTGVRARAARLVRPREGLMAGALGVAAAGYAECAVTASARYGHLASPHLDAADPLVDRFMASSEIVEWHHVAVAAPVEVTFAAAWEMDLNQTAANLLS